MLAKEIEQIKEIILLKSGVNPKKCMVCGKCSGTCPISIYRSLVSLGRYIPKYFILSVAMVNGIVSLISLFSHC